MHIGLHYDAFCENVENEISEVRRSERACLVEMAKKEVVRSSERACFVEMEVVVRSSEMAKKEVVACLVRMVVRRSGRACLVEMVKEKVDAGTVQNPGVVDEIDLKTEWYAL